VGLPEALQGTWAEILNTDAQVYGGSGVGNHGAALASEPVPAHGQAASLGLTLPPLGTLFLARR
jgi:1,4-alpha-glucan branching enzyme